MHTNLRVSPTQSCLETQEAGGHFKQATFLSLPVLPGSERRTLYVQDMYSTITDVLQRGHSSE